MTPAKLAELRRATGGFRGRFFYDGERGDLAFVAERCEVGDCDCEQKLNSDGDQDCSVAIGDFDDDVFGEPIALMLNSVGALIDLVDAARAPEAHWECQQRIDRLEEQLAAANAEIQRLRAKLESSLDTSEEQDRLRQVAVQQLAAVTRAKDEACKMIQLLIDAQARYSPAAVAASPEFADMKREIERRIAALRSVGKEPGK